LLSKFKAENPSITEDVTTTTIKAFDAYVKKNLPLLSQDINIGSFNHDSTDKYGHVLQGKSVDGVGPPGDKEAGKYPRY
jgi:cysteinyl-tRNA synthetase